MSNIEVEYINNKIPFLIQLKPTNFLLNLKNKTYYNHTPFILKSIDPTEWTNTDRNEGLISFFRGGTEDIIRCIIDKISDTPGNGLDIKVFYNEIEKWFGIVIFEIYGT